MAAQAPLSGRVVSAVSGEGLPFATVVPLPEGGDGVYTDADGYFQLTDSGNVDSLRGSMIGFETYTIAAAKNSTIALKPTVYTTEEITVSDRRKSRIVRYGNTKFGIVTNGYSSFAGSKVVRYVVGDWENNGTLESISYRISAAVKRGCEVYARAHVYSALQIGLSGGPDKELLRRDVVFPLKAGKQLYEIDLREDNINFPPEGLCVGIEFLGAEPGCETDNRWKNRFYVLVSRNEDLQVTYSARKVGSKKWGSFVSHWRNETGRHINAKFGAKVRY